MVQVRLKIVLCRERNQDPKPKIDILKNEYDNKRDVKSDSKADKPVIIGQPVLFFFVTGIPQDYDVIVLV